jgi:hypothetical protein
MTNQISAAGNHDGAEPTVPLVPSGGYRQPEVPPLEDTSPDVLGLGDYPDFSYDESTQQLRADAVTGIDPNPLPAASNYTQPAVPTSTFAEPYRPTPTGYPQSARGSDAVSLASAPASTGTQYQQYPLASPTPLRDPVAYDYGYARPLLVVPDHPSAVLSLVLGLVGLFVFPLLPSVAAWIVAGRARRDIATYPGRWANSGTLTAGFVLGIIGTVFWILFTAAYVGFFALIFWAMAR